MNQEYAQKGGFWNLVHTENGCKAEVADQRFNDWFRKRNRLFTPRAARYFEKIPCHLIF